MKNKFKEGDICPQTITYGQFCDETDRYVGIAGDRYVREGHAFPAGKPGCYFSELYEEDTINHNRFREVK